MASTVRVTHILNHLSKSTDNNIQKHQITQKVNINENYKCRMIAESDYSAILEICANIFDGNDFIPHSFHRWLNDKTGDIMFFGIEYKPESKIIATRAIKLLDGGITGHLMAGRVHSKHRGKGLYTPFMTWSNQIIRNNYPNLIRTRSTAYGKNAASRHLQSKTKISSSNIIQMLYGHVSYPSNKSDTPNYGPQLIRPNEFEQRLFIKDLDELSCAEIEILTDIDEIIKLLTHRYEKNEVYVDWKVYDLKLNQKCIEYNKSLLKKEIISRRLTVYLNKTKSVMCMVYIDGRKRLTQIHVYGDNAKCNEKNILLMIQTIYKMWKVRTYPDVVIDPLNGIKLYVFIDQEIVINNPRLGKLCENFDIVVVTEKPINND